MKSVQLVATAKRILHLHMVSTIYTTNFNLQGDLILEVGHIIEAITKIVDVTKKSQNVKIMEAGT